MWCKHSNLEQAIRVPLFLFVPGLTKGKKYEKPGEFVDIYPTICELNGLSIGNYLDGKSLVPALKDNQNTIKEFAISQYPRAGIGTELDREIMGYSLRTNQYRFTEWVGNFFNTAKPFKKEDVKDIELYDLINDPLETKNIANLPSMKEVVKILSDKLHSYYDQQYKTAGIIANQ
ncbi:MAG: sulfatase/phosphatase domain-containing protein [Chitinophagaceae bacterium]